MLADAVQLLVQSGDDAHVSGIRDAIAPPQSFVAYQLDFLLRCQSVLAQPPAEQRDIVRVHSHLHLSAGFEPADDGAGQFFDRKPVRLQLVVRDAHGDSRRQLYCRLLHLVEQLPLAIRQTLCGLNQPGDGVLHGFTFLSLQVFRRREFVRPAGCRIGRRLRIRRERSVWIGQSDPAKWLTETNVSIVPHRVITNSPT